MLQNRSRLSIVDNSGMTRVRAFWVRAGHRQTARVGDVRVASVQEVTSGSSMKRGDVVRVLLVRSRGPRTTGQGRTLSFDDNAAIVVQRVAKTGRWAPVGTRMAGPVSRTLRRLGHSQVLARADAVL